MTATRSLRVVVRPSKGSQVRFGDDPQWFPVSDAGDVEHMVTGDVRVAVRNECCQEDGTLVTLGTSEISFDLQQMPANVIAVCNLPGPVRVTINGRPWKLDEPFTEPFPPKSTQTSKQFDVTFTGEHVSLQMMQVQVRAHETTKVQCAPP
jgi:hypothetical protein